MGGINVKTDNNYSFLDSEINGEVVNTQTTYVDLAVSYNNLKRALYRIHFDQKQEFQLEKRTFTRVSITDKHPLLIDYHEVGMDVHLSGTVIEKSEFAEALQRAAFDTFGIWRTYSGYLNVPLDQFLKRAYGVLMTAPESFANRVVGLAPAFAVTLFLRNERPSRGEFKVLLLDELFVVAKDFRLQLMGYL